MIRSMNAVILASFVVVRLRAVRRRAEKAVPVVADDRDDARDRAAADPAICVRR